MHPGKKSGGGSKPAAGVKEWGEGMAGPRPWDDASVTTWAQRVTVSCRACDRLRCVGSASLVRHRCAPAHGVNVLTKVHTMLSPGAGTTAAVWPVTVALDELHSSDVSDQPNGGPTSVTVYV